IPHNGDYSIEQLGNGLINHTFRITDHRKHHSLLLQQINRNVFKNPVDVQDNYLKLWNFKNGNDLIFLPKPVPLNNHENLFIDSHGNYWRAFEFLKDTVTLDVPQNADQAYATAKTFGQLTAMLSGFNPDILHIVIPDFHNLSYR